MFVHSLKYSLIVLGTVGLWACAHNIKPVDIPQTANPTEEIDKLSADLQKARQNRTDVLAPENFAKAQDKLEDAQKRRSNGEGGEKILKSVALGHAYLNEANTIAESTKPQMADLIKAREAAIAGGANQYASDLSGLDGQFKKYGERFEIGKKVDRDDLTQLQAKYYDLELKAIKGTKLSESENILRNAEKKGAKSLTPQAYAEAKEKIASAEKTIEVDRHNAAAVDGAVAVAADRANRTLILVDIARENKNRSPEEVAREIESRMVAFNRESAQRAAAQMRVNSKDRQLTVEREQVSALSSQKQQLEEKENFNRAFEQARAEFDSKEADVYRQGDNMIIRLKSMQFPSGRADLPGSSLAVLSKVKGVIGQLNTQEVVVEGHTDSVGSAQLNKDLSTQRAAAVAKYFVAENVLSSEKVEVVGLGDTKPISSNKSKEGRAQNRRVDIIIKSSKATGASNDGDSRHVE